jgi:3-mercaptopyruvate sulfurtransferase SseA
MKHFRKTIFSLLAIAAILKRVEMAEVEIATYEEVKDLPNHPEKLLIDVREPHELEATGQIPTSINIPRE